jgi:methylglutaconyl-CoA hydratase
MNNTHQDGFVLTEISETGIGLITFGHPMSNSLPGHILQTLADTITELAADERTKVLVLQSQGSKAFCAGADLKAFAELSREQAELRHLSLLERCFEDILGCGKPVVASVQAAAVGAGLMLAALCDEILMVK